MDDMQMMRMRKSALIFPELSYQLNGLLFQVHNELGRFCREKQYADLFEIKLRECGMQYEREKELPIEIEERSIKGNKIDFMIERRILVDLKAKPFVTKSDYYQMRRYLDAARLKLGLIVNFHRRYLHPKRIVNSRVKKFSS